MGRGVIEAPKEEKKSRATVFVVVYKEFRRRKRGEFFLGRPSLSTSLPRRGTGGNRQHNSSFSAIFYFWSKVLLLTPQSPKILFVIAQLENLPIDCGSGRGTKNECGI